MKILRLVTINIIIFLILTELILRIFWNSPYLPYFKDAYFHAPNLNLKFKNIDKLYDYNKTILFRTSELGNIIGNDNILEKSSIYALAVGGSSTESALVPEGMRWPDLLSIPTYNFGKSRLNSSHTVANLKFIFENYNLEPKAVFVTDNVNNLSNYLKWGKDGLSSPEFIKNKDLYKFILTNYYTAAFIFLNIKKSDYFLFYKLDVDRRKKIEEISRNELDNYLRLNRNKMFNSIKIKFNEMKDISIKNNFDLFILTQPNSYNNNFKIHNYDIRITPIINKKILSIENAKKISDFYNDLTIEVAKSIGINFIDINKCFQKSEIEDLLYDSFHLTINGSKYFAKCINYKISDYLLNF